MAKQIELFHTTGKYRVSYDYLNDHEYLGQAKVLAARNKSESDDGTSVQFTQRVVAGSWFDASNPKHVERVARSIAYSFSRDCRCEHDCCGCWNGGAWVEHVKGREFIARASYGANV